jgi:hypothetical protein
MTTNLVYISQNTNASSSLILSVNHPQEQSPILTSTIQVAKKGIGLALADESLKGWEKLKALIAENQQEIKRELIVPVRRICNFGGMESNYTIHLAKNSIFITDDEILKVHPVRFLSKSPFVPKLSEEDKKHYAPDENNFFWESIFDSINKKLLAIAVTENDKHIILQQAVKSCVPTCVGMLVLDHGKTLNYKAIRFTNLANREDAMKWVRQAGLTPHLTDLSNKQDCKADILAKCLEEHGPGVLDIVHPNIKGHVIVLDEISKIDNIAIIRDSFHGWALTIKLDALLSWIDKDSYFIQISSD